MGLSRPVQPDENSRDQWFETLVGAVGGDLLRFLRSRLSQEDQAQDLAQEVYLRLLRMENVRLIRNPRAFVIHLAAHAAHEWRMLARNRLEHSEDYLDQLIADHADPAESLEREARIESLARVLETLNPKCRAVVLMNRRDGMTCAEIAARLNLSVAMVKKHLARGLAACHKHLNASDGER